MTTESAKGGRAKPKSILFVCNQNAVRSPIAKALMDRSSKRRVFAESAGIMAGTLDPFAVAVMAEQKINLEKHSPKTLDAIDISKFDTIVALTPESRDVVMAMLPSAASLEGAPVMHYWPIVDPTGTRGSRDSILENYRAVRDQLNSQIAGLLA